MIYPDKCFMPTFHRLYTGVKIGKNKLYRFNYDMDFCVRLPESYNRKMYKKFKGNNYTVVIKRGKMFFYIKAGFIWDGVTMGWDFKSRMLFSLLHDICCYASQKLKSKVFEHAFELVDYDVLRKQGANPFLAWYTDRAVLRYDSYSNRYNDPNV